MYSITNSETYIIGPSEVGCKSYCYEDTFAEVLNSVKFLIHTAFAEFFATYMAAEINHKRSVAERYLVCGVYAGLEYVKIIEFDAVSTQNLFVGVVVYEVEADAKFTHFSEAFQGVELEVIYNPRLAIAKIFCDIFMGKRQSEIE